MSTSPTIWDDDHLPYGAPGSPLLPPTERGGIHVGDKVTLVSMTGREWPVQVMCFTSLPDDIVVKWQGLRPLAALTPSGQSTIDRRQLKTILEKS